MDDPERLESHPPLPGDALAATVTFLAARGGLAPGYRAVPRSAATHAELRITGLSGRAEERRVELAEAERWLAEARDLQERGALLDAQARERRDRDAERRADLAATIDLECPRCGSVELFRPRLPHPLGG